MLSNLKSFLAKNYLSILIVAFAGLGFIAAFTLSVEKIDILKDPDKVLNCDINSFFSCGIVMRSEYSEVFGIPWSFLGMAGYPATALAGLILLERRKLSRWLTWLLTLPSFLAFVLSTYFMWLSAYVIGVFCPWCILSAVSSTCIFFAMLTLHLQENNFGLSAKLNARIQPKIRQGWPIVLAVLWIIGILLLEWYPFYINSL